MPTQGPRLDAEGRVPQPDVVDAKRDLMKECHARLPGGEPCRCRAAQLVVRKDVGSELLCADHYKAFRAGGTVDMACDEERLQRGIDVRDREIQQLRERLTGALGKGSRLVCLTVVNIHGGEHTAYGTEELMRPQYEAVRDAMAALEGGEARSLEITGSADTYQRGDASFAILRDQIRAAHIVEV